MPMRDNEPIGRRSPSLHRSTPIPESMPSSGKISSTPSICGSISEETEEESTPWTRASGSDGGRVPGNRMPLVAESLAQIPEVSPNGANSQGGIEGLRGYRNIRSGASSPSLSETSDTSRTPFSLHRPTPIPGEASGTLSGQSSFSSMKRGRNLQQKIKPTISEELEEMGDEEELKDVPSSSFGLSERQDSVKSTGSMGSLHRPTPIPLDMHPSLSKLGRYSGNKLPNTPTIHEDEDIAANGKGSGPKEFQMPRDFSGTVSKDTNGSQNQSSKPKALTAAKRSSIQDTAIEYEHTKESGLPPLKAPDRNSYDSASSPPAFKPLNSASIAETAQIRQDGDSNSLQVPTHKKTQSLGQASHQSGSPMTPFVDNRDSERDLIGVARFLRMTPGLSRKVIGDLLGEDNERCIRILEMYTATFDFKGLSFEASLREYLESFRLPGESQKIFRILEVWSKQFYQQNGGKTFKSADAVLQVAFSLVLLNTDRHNPQVKRKMSKPEFVNNTLSAVEDKEFPGEFLENLYDNIQRRALRMPPPHSTPSTSTFRRSTSLPDAARRTQKQYEESPQTETKTTKRKTSFFCF